MTKKQDVYVVVEREYCSDGVYMHTCAMVGTKLQCERYLYEYNHHNPMLIMLEKEFDGEDEDEAA